MSIENVRIYLRALGREQDICEFDQSSATVALAAEALGVEGARIAKTLAFERESEGLLVVMAGDAKVDNKKFKACFGLKAKMLEAEQVLLRTGHAVGGTCPFALQTKIPVFLDVSLQRFSTVFPACGSGNSAIELSCEELFALSGAADWVDVGKDWA